MNSPPKSTQTTQNPLNLELQLGPPQQAAAENPQTRRRKRALSWTEDEHKLLLIGQVICGETSWTAISQKIVKTKTPTQLAGHGKNHSDKAKAREWSDSGKSSIFDITEVDEASIDDLVRRQLLSPEHASQYLDSTRFQVAAQDGTQQALPPSDPRN